MHPRAVPRLARPDAPPVALHHGQARGLLGTSGQGIARLRIGIASLLQFAAHIMHDALDGLGRYLQTGAIAGCLLRPLKRTRFRSEHRDPQHHGRRQFPGIKPQRLA